MKAHTLALLIPFAVLAACSRSEPLPPAASATVAPAEPAAAANVTLAGASGSTVSGELHLIASGTGVAVTGQLSGLTASTAHGFHFHETGDCSAADASSAGAHLNPFNGQHAGPTATDRHLGDLPNIESDTNGNAAVSATVTGATLGDGASNDLVGKAIIVHAKRDDYVTQPSGDSGDRIACGVVR